MKMINVIGIVLLFIAQAVSMDDKDKQDNHPTQVIVEKKHIEKPNTSHFEPPLKRILSRQTGMSDLRLKEEDNEKNTR